MKYILLLFVIIQINNTKGYKIDFKSTQNKDWIALNDGVMGGRSTGTVHIDKKALNFVGELSLANNGGFASVRSSYQNYKLSNYSKVKIRYKSTGKQFAITLELSERWYDVYYKFYLSNTGNRWKETEIELKNFVGYQVGTNTGNTITEKQLGEIIRLGFMTSEKEAGYYELKIDYIHFY